MILFLNKTVLQNFTLKFSLLLIVQPTRCTCFLDYLFL